MAAQVVERAAQQLAKGLPSGLFGPRFALNRPEQVVQVPHEPGIGSAGREIQITENILGDLPDLARQFGPFH